MSDTEYVTVTNHGTTPFSVGSVNPTVPGDFYFADNECPAPLQAGDSCTLGFTFQTSQTGTRNGSALIYSSSSSTPDTVVFTGTGK